jgi:hypothetical protein
MSDDKKEVVDLDLVDTLRHIFGDESVIVFDENTPPLVLKCSRCKFETDSGLEAVAHERLNPKHVVV